MLATERVQEIPQQLGGSLATGDAATKLVESIHIPEFDPKIHLNFIPPTVRYSFTKLGLNKPHNAPDTCYTEPFQLFSEEGVRVMRRELFRKELLDKYMRSWSRAPCYVGGFSSTEGVPDFNFFKPGMMLI